MKKKIASLVVVAGLATMLVGADGGGCGGGKDVNMMAMFDALPFCPLYAKINPVAVASGQIFACNTDPSALPPTVIDRIADELPHVPCVTLFCAADLDGAYAQADALVSVSAAEGAAAGLRCDVVGTTIGHARTFRPSPAFTAICIIRTKPQDGGALAPCTDVNGPCDGTGSLAPCCAGLVCDQGERGVIPPTFGQCCVDVDESCFSNSDCCRGHCEGAGNYCYCNLDGESCTGDLDCCIGTACVEDGTVPGGRACH